MPRKKFIYSNHLPYHVVTRTNNKQFFQLPMNEVFNLFETWLNISSLIYETKTHHFELMTNHIHWILTTPQENLGQIVSHLLSNVSKDINLKLSRQNHVFGPRYKWSLIQKPQNYPFVVKYLYRNATEAGICERVEDYPYSTLGAYFGIHKCGIKISMDFFFEEFEISANLSRANLFLKWLNTPYRKEDADAIHDALTRKEFRFHKIKRNKRYEPSDFNFYSIKD